MSDIVLYHNPRCGTSRNTLAMIRNSGEDALVIEYLKTRREVPRPAYPQAPARTSA
jgi:arsenate reductase-like glutaredoxin family protein